MRRIPLLMLLPLTLLVACQSSPPTQRPVGQCNPREADAGNCNVSSSIYVFPELSNAY